MQKSKNATLAIILLILGYGLFATFKLIVKYNIAYLYIINPIFWISLVIALRLLLGKTTENKNRFRPEKAGTDFYSVAAITALMVCMRFSASSKTMDWGPSKTSSVTSMQSTPNFS